MSVYNVQEFIEEAVESIFNQDIGFEQNVQIVMVNDGSKDNSGELCDKFAARYPKNIKVIHKTNGGLSSARNEGLKHVEGKYVNFFDPDDVLTKNTLSSVYEFFEQNQSNIDMVAIPLHYFDAKTGEHPTNKGKFEKGNSIIDLEKTPTLIHNSVASSFFKHNVAKKLYFDPNLCSMEDAKTIIQFLAFNPRYGVVSNVKYMYRQRSTGAVSLSHGDQLRKNWYTDFLKRFSLEIIDFCKNNVGYVPKFVQCVLLYDLQWKIKQQHIPDGVLTDKEKEAYRKTLYSVFKHIDDDLILNSKHYYFEHKANIIYKKYKNKIKLNYLDNDLQLQINNLNFRKFSKICNTTIERFHIENNQLHIDANTFILPFIQEKIKTIKPYLSINGKMHECKTFNRVKNQYIADEVVFVNIPFKTTLEIDDSMFENNKIELQLYLKYDEHFVKLNSFSFSDFSAVSNHYKQQYCVMENYIASMINNTFIIEKYSKSLAKNKEKDFQKELWKSNKLGERKAVVVRKIYQFLKNRKKKNIYIISDRINKADDNGEAMLNFFNSNPKFVKENNIEYYYIIDKNCEDYKRIKNKHVIQVYGFKHKLMHLFAKTIISSHADNFINKPMYETFECYRDLVVGQNFVFLQHGITKDDISGWLNYYNKNIAGFITAAKPETKSMFTYNYFYKNENIWETGFARFDRLYNDEKKYITLMPTWRKYLMNGHDEQTGIWQLNQNFLKSYYFNFYNNLINNEKLLNACDKYGFTLCFMPHPNIIPHIDVFDKNEKVKFFGISDKYRDIYAQSNLILSDYSSAVFDFSYLRKPIIYAHFDSEEFFKGEHVYTKGYFDYERDGFGEVTKTLEETINLMIAYMKNNCKLKSKYEKRINRFFAFNDKNNCERIAKQIVKHSKKR